MCRIQKYDVETQTLHVKIEQGSLPEHAFDTSTNANAELFKDVVINNIVLVTRRYIPQPTPIPYNPPKRKETFKPYEPPPVEEPTPSDITSTVKIKIEDLTFEDGKVVFDADVLGIKYKKGPYEVENDFILKRYDPLKPYFAKFFEKGKLTFHFRLTLLQGELIDKKVSSDDLQKINQSMIDWVEDKMILDTVVNNETETVRDIDEILESTIIASLNKDAEWLLSKLFDAGKTKHYYHLTYLAGLQQKDVANIKTTGRPFSFMFCVATEGSYYFVWEPYSTKEATYIWRVDKSDQTEVRIQLQKTEELIKDLRNNQKRAYRAQEKNNPNFRVIEHDYSLDKFGFEVWKEKFGLFAL